MSTSVTSLRLTSELRDRIKAGAKKHGDTQAEYIERALRELEHREFLRGVAAAEMDDEDRAEYEQWEQAPIGPVVPE
jgi:predicted DNA-binding protein